MFSGLFSLIGTVVSIYTLAKLTIWILQNFVIKSNLLSQKMNRNGDNWALVTGCTSGIGEGFAAELASRKLNMILVSRNPEKLNAQVTELETKYKIKTKIVAVDFEKEEPSEYMKKISDSISDISNITVLVNNVGINHDVPARFLEVPIEEQENIIKVNISCSMNVTRAVLPKMKDQKTGGIVINTGSYTGTCPVPLLSVYSASKAFLDAWTTSLQGEYKKVAFFNITPMYVVSQMSGFKKPTFTACTGRKLAQDTLNQIGEMPLVSPTISFSPHWTHTAQILLQKWMPFFALSSVQLSAMEGVRKKTLARRAKAL